MIRAIQIIALTAFALAASQLSAQETVKEAEKTESRALQWAEDTAKVAGAAAYCALDADTVEEYIGLAQAKIAAIANDKVDRVVARIEFGNVYNVASSQEPAGGCTIFAQLFPQEASKLN